MWARPADVPRAPVRRVSEKSGAILFEPRCFRSYLAKRFSAVLGVFTRLRDVNFTQPGAYPCPGRLELGLAVSRSTPLPLALAPGLPCTEQFHDHCARWAGTPLACMIRPNRQVAPDHGEVVVVALARDHGNASCGDQSFFLGIGGSPIRGFGRGGLLRTALLRENSKSHI